MNRLRTSASHGSPFAHRAAARVLALVAAVIFICILSSGSVLATEFSWDVGDGSFGARSSWTPDNTFFHGPPLPSDSALFAQGGSHTVSFSNDRTTIGAIVRDGSYEFDLSGHTYGAVVASTVGDTAGLSASLTLRDGTLQSVLGHVASAPGSSGIVNVGQFGSPAVWSLSNTLYVGGNSTVAGGVGQVTVAYDSIVRSDSLIKIWDSGTLSTTLGEIIAGGSALESLGNVTVGSDATGQLVYRQF